MSTLGHRIYTPDEYLRLERAADHRSEFVNGRIHAKSGASRNHNQIVFNLAREIGTRLKGRPCEAYVSDMRVKVSRTGLYTYPDLVAHCGETLLEDAYGDTLLNPSVIVEVLSDSTEKYDRGGKFAHYRSLDSLREYVLVSQNLPRVEQYVRNGELWTLKVIDGLDASISIETLECTVALADIYDHVEFPSIVEREPELRRTV
jgi:Uma2 family endonuclease